MLSHCLSIKTIEIKTIPECPFLVSSESHFQDNFYYYSEGRDLRYICDFPFLSKYITVPIQNMQICLLISLDSYFLSVYQVLGSGCKAPSRTHIHSLSRGAYSRVAKTLPNG